MSNGQSVSYVFVPPLLNVLKVCLLAPDMANDSQPSCPALQLHHATPPCIIIRLRPVPHRPALAQS